MPPIPVNQNVPNPRNDTPSQIPIANRGVIPPIAPTLPISHRANVIGTFPGVKPAPAPPGNPDAPRYLNRYHRFIGRKEPPSNAAGRADALNLRRQLENERIRLLIEETKARTAAIPQPTNTIQSAGTHAATPADDSGIAPDSQFSSSGQFLNSPLLVFGILGVGAFLFFRKKR
jgi:hypothetical protein